MKKNKIICRIEENGTKRWYVNGIIHRTNIPSVISKNGDQGWFFEGNLHRLDGPAVENKNGYKAWYVHGVPHRLDGPALIFPEGRKEWNINGLNATDHITPWAKECGIDLDNLTDVDKLLIKLTWADYNGKV